MCDLGVVNINTLKFSGIASSLIIASHATSDIKPLSIGLLIFGWMVVYYIVKDFIDQTIIIPAIIGVVLSSIILLFYEDNILAQVVYIASWSAFGYAISSSLPGWYKWTGFLPVIVKIIAGIILRKQKTYTLALNIIAWSTISIILSIPRNFGKDLQGCIDSIKSPIAAEAFQIGQCLYNNDCLKSGNAIDILTCGAKNNCYGQYSGSANTILTDITCGQKFKCFDGVTTLDEPTAIKVAECMANNGCVSIDPRLKPFLDTVQCLQTNGCTDGNPSIEDVVSCGAAKNCYGQYSAAAVDVLKDYDCAQKNGCFNNTTPFDKAAMQRVLACMAINSCF